MDHTVGVFSKSLWSEERDSSSITEIVSLLVHSTVTLIFNVEIHINSAQNKSVNYIKKFLYSIIIKFDLFSYSYCIYYTMHTSCTSTLYFFPIVMAVSIIISFSFVAELLVLSEPP